MGFSVAVAHKGCLVESHAQSSLVLVLKLIALSLNTLSTQAALAAVSCSTLIISLHLASHASFLESLLRWFPLFSLSVLLVLYLEQQWLHEPTCNVHRAQMGQDVYI